MIGLGSLFRAFYILLVPSAYRELSLRLGLLQSFSASWDLRFLFGCFLVLSAF